MGLSILVYGPLSDKVGRKPVVIFGLGLACIASYATVWVQHVTLFLMLRFLQGAGSGVCWGLGRIIAADVLQGKRLAAIGSYFTLFLSLSPLLAPAIGGYIQHWFGWQANFILLGTIILAVLLVFMICFEETNQHKNPQAFVLGPLINNYLSLFRHRIFIGCALLTGIAMSANIIYMTTSSFIFQQQFHTSPIVFGWLTAIVGAAGIAGKLIAPFFILRLESRKLLIIGVSLLLFGGLLLSVFTLLQLVSIPIVLISVSMTIFAMVFIGGITMSMALSPFHDKRGSAGALFGSFQLLISFAFSAMVASFPHIGTDLLAGAYVLLGVLGFGCYFSLVRER